MPERAGNRIGGGLQSPGGSARPAEAARWSRWARGWGVVACASTFLLPASVATGFLTSSVRPIVGILTAWIGLFCGSLTFAMVAQLTAVVRKEPREDLAVAGRWIVAALGANLIQKIVAFWLLQLLAR